MSIDTKKTLQDVLDEMTPEQKDLQALVVGAALDNVDISEDQEIVRQFEALPDEIKYMTTFIVGDLLDKEEAEAKHSDPVENFLAHYGVKGMKWGVRRDLDSSTRTTRLSKSTLNTSASRYDARHKVKSGTASEQETLIAGLKSNGHRALNAFTGDKTFWRRMGITAAVGAGGVVAASFSPAILPASFVTAVGASVAGTHGVAGHVLLDGSLMSIADIGAATITALGIAGAGVGVGVSAATNYGLNAVRAVRNNARIDKMANPLGNKLFERQQRGNSRVDSVLGKKKREVNAKHDAVDTEEFLSHYGVKGMKWGVRRESNRGTSTSKDEVREKALTALKVTAKYAAVPAVVAAGTAAGLPAVSALGVSARALMTPEVQEAAKAATSFSKSAISDVKDVSLSKLPKVDFDKVWGTKTTTRTVTDDFSQKNPSEKIWNARTPDGNYVILKPTQERPFPTYKDYVEGKVKLGR